MTKTSWQRSPAALAAAAVVLPPVGLIWLWLRPGTGTGRKVLGSLLIAVIGVAQLFAFYGLRVELDGTGMYPIFSFHKPESHYAALERLHSETPSEAEPRAQEIAHAAAPAPAVPAPPAAASSTPLDYWTNFRGPHRDGRYDEMPVRTNWPAAGLPLVWKQPVGGGYASFVVAEGRAFTIEQRRHQEVVAAYDMATGRQLWSHGWDAEFQESMGGDGPRATPTYDEGRLYALGATGELRALQARTGKQLWRVNILEDNGAPNLTWGMSAAPLVAEGKVIVLPGGRGGKSVAAYDKLTGRPVWKALDDKQSYTSPQISTLAGRRQLVVVSAERVMGLTIEDGTLLWEYPWTTMYDINVSQPIVVGENRFFISAGYDHGAAVVELTPQGNGFAAQTVWSNNRMKNKFTSSVLHEGYIYGLDESILACIDPKTGEQKWKGGRYGYGQVVLASGHLIVTTETGEVVLVKATPEKHEEVAKFSALSGKTWNHPALAGGKLLVRNTTEMACFNIAR